MTLQGGAEQKLDKLLFCELQYFDLVREMDKVPEFVSPDIPTWKVWTDHKINMHQITPMHDKIKSKEHAFRRNPKMLQKHKIALFQQLVLKGFY